MRKGLQTLTAKKAEVINKMESLLAAADKNDRELNEDEQKQFDENKKSLESLNKRIANEQALYESRQTEMDIVTDVNADTRQEIVARGGDGGEELGEHIDFVRRGTLRCFQDDDKMRAEVKALRFGRFLQAIAGVGMAREFCRKNGIPLTRVQEGNISIGAVYNEGVNTQGGYLVRPEFDADIIRLVIQYGKFRQNCRVVPMGSDVKERDRRTGGLTAYFVGESDAGTESTGSWDQVKLIAKKIMVLTRITNELNADSVIDNADNIAFEVALAFATLEDQCGFIGDGTSTYGGIYGISPKLLAINGVDDGGGLVLGAGNLMSEITLANFNSMVGILPEYAETGAAWYMSKFCFATTLERLMAAAGGNSWLDLANGKRTRSGLGYPVVTTETLPKADANSQIVALFGDLRLAADLGDRAQMTIAVSDSASVGGQSVFERDQLAFRATERFDINVHDVGDATNAGPVVALISAAG